MGQALRSKEKSEDFYFDPAEGSRSVSVLVLNGCLDLFVFKACGQIWQQGYTIIAKRIKPPLPSLSIKACCYAHHLSKKLWESGYSTKQDLFSQRMGEIQLFRTEKWTSNLSYMSTYVKHKLSNNNEVSSHTHTSCWMNQSDPIYHLPRSNEDKNTDANGHILSSENHEF